MTTPSESNASESSTTPSAEAKSAETKATPKATRREKWRRRFFVLVTTLVVIGLAFRLLLHVLFPAVLDRVAKTYGLHAEYDKLDLSVLGADVGIWGLRFTPVNGGQPVISMAYCRGAISTFGLLKLELHVKRVEAEDAEVLVERLADGSLPLVERLLGASTASVPAPTSVESKPPSLDAPFTIDTLRLQNARARFRDATLTPATDVTLQMDLLVRDVGSPDRRTQVELQLNSPETLAALYVTADGASRGNHIDANLAVRMVGLNLLPARAYLEPLGIVPQSQDISAQAKGTLKASLTAAAQPSTRPTTGPAAGALQASLALNDIVFTADAMRAASVRSLRVDAREVSPGAIRVDQIKMTDVRANVARTEAGLIAFAGIEVGATPSAAPTTQSKSIATSKPSAASGAMPIVEVDRFDVSDVALTFVDHALTNTLAINVPQWLVEHFSTDPAKSAMPARFTLNANAPGVAKQVMITGDIASAAPIKTAVFSVSVTGIQADAIGPYLRPLGIDETFNDGSFTCSLGGEFERRADGTSHATLDLANIKLADGAHDLIEVSHVAIRDASFDLKLNRVRLEAIDLAGPTLPITRDADGTIRLIGLRTIAAASTTPPPIPAPATSISVPTSAPAAIFAGLPSFEIGKLAWHGSKITLDDHATGGPPLNVVLDDITAGIEDLTLSTHGAAKPGKITLNVRAPGLIAALDIAGIVTPAADSLAFAIHGDSTGITFDRIRPLLAQLHLEPVMKSGTFHVEVDGTVRNDAGVYRADAAIRNASLSDGDAKWLGIGNARLGGASFDGKRLHVETIQIDAPHAMIDRDDAGRLSIVGIKLLPAVAQASSVIATGGPVAPTQVDLSLPLVAQLDSLVVNNASVDWKDASVLPAARVSMTARVTAKDIVVGEDASAASFAIDLSSPGVVDRLGVSGTFKLAPHEQMMTAAIAGTGLSGKAIEAYLPPVIGVDLSGRSIAASLSASLKPDARGGSSGAFELKDAKITTADGTTSDAAIRSARAVIDRVDLPGKMIAIDEFSADGAQFGASQDAVGLHALGVTISPTPLRATRPAPRTAEPVAGAGANDVAAIVRTSNETMPLITLKRLSLNADRLAFSSAALSEPVVLSNATLTNDANVIAIGGPTPADNPAIHLRASGSLEKLIGSLSADARLAPFAPEPTAALTLDANHIDGTGITRLLPSLNSLIDCQDLSNARFVTALNSRFQFARRGPLGIDLTRDVTGEIGIKGMQLTVSGDDRPLIGIGEIRAEKIRVSPSSGSIVVGAFDIVKPIASVVREADGVHVAGITLRILQPKSAASSQPPIQEVVDTAENPALPQAATVEAIPTSKSSPDIRIDRLTMSGVDIRIEDRVNEPHSIIPVTDLDLEVIGLSTRALTEARPVRFSGVVSSGKIPLPPRKLKVGVETEDREVFAEASTNGNLMLYPKPSGYVRASISGLELTAVRGLASEYGLTLGGGTFDGRLDVRLKNADTFEAKVWPTFNELRMKEVPDGPIQSTFRLPAPPDVVISTIEDVDGSLTFPFTVPIDAGKLDTGALIGSAVGSVGKVLAEAMIAAPLKAGKFMGSLVGLDMSSDRIKGLEPIAIEFASGESQLDGDQDEAMQRVRDLMRKDPTIEVTIQHELGSDDVALADERVNLGVDDSSAIATQLLSRKRDLQRRYAEQSADVVVAIATQDPARVEAPTARLRETATQLKLTEDGLDSVFDLLRPGADRQATRRTKAAAILLADLRLRCVQEALQRANVPNASDRVRRSSALFNPLESGPGRVRLVLTRRAKS
jgi:hypothetical protein